MKCPDSEHLRFFFFKDCFLNLPHISHNIVLTRSDDLRSDSVQTLGKLKARITGIFSALAMLGTKVAVCSLFLQRWASFAHVGVRDGRTQVPGCSRWGTHAEYVSSVHSQSAALSNPCRFWIEDVFSSFLPPFHVFMPSWGKSRIFSAFPVVN